VPSIPFLGFYFVRNTIKFRLIYGRHSKCWELTIEENPLQKNNTRSEENSPKTGDLFTFPRPRTHLAAYSKSTNNNNNEYSSIG